MKIDETKIAYCKKLYLEQKGKDHRLIEKSMREVGYSFSTRSLYCSKGRPGWIMKYGWKKELAETRSVPPAVAGGSTLPSDNRSLPASGDSDFLSRSSSLSAAKPS